MAVNSDAVPAAAAQASPTLPGDALRIALPCLTVGLRGLSRLRLAFQNPWFGRV